MSENRKIRYVKESDLGAFKGYSVLFDEISTEVSRAENDYLRRKTAKAFRLAEIDGELYVLVMSTVSHEVSDSTGRAQIFREIEEGFDDNIELPGILESYEGQKNKIINAIKITKDGLLEKPSDELMKDLLSRKGSYHLNCYGSLERDLEDQESPDVSFGIIGKSESDINDKFGEEELVTASELGIQVMRASKGITLMIGDKPIRIRNNGTIRDEKGNKFQRGRFMPHETELATAALQKVAADQEYRDVVAKARNMTKELAGPGEDD